MFNVQSRKINPQILEAQLKQLTCIYRNESEFSQIIRISQPSSAFFERAILPNQCVQFSAPTDALLEIYEGVMFSCVHSDTIPCSQLVIATDIDMNQNRLNAKETNRDFQDVFSVAV